MNIHVSCTIAQNRHEKLSGFHSNTRRFRDQVIGYYPLLPVRAMSPVSVFAHRHIYCFRYTRRTAVARAEADDGADENYFLTVVAYQSYCRPKLLSLLQSATLPGRGLRYVSPAHAPRVWTRKQLGASCSRSTQLCAYTPTWYSCHETRSSTTRLKPVYYFEFWCRFHVVGPPKQIHPECRPPVLPPPHASIICVRLLDWVRLGYQTIPLFMVV